MGGFGLPRVGHLKSVPDFPTKFLSNSHSLSLGRPRWSQDVRKVRCRRISFQFLLAWSCRARSLLLFALRGQSLRSCPIFLASRLDFGSVSPKSRPRSARNTKSAGSHSISAPRREDLGKKPPALQAPIRKAKPNKPTQNYRPARRSFITILSSQKAPSLLIQRGSQPRERARHFPEPSKEK